MPSLLVHIHWFTMGWIAEMSGSVQHDGKVSWRPLAKYTFASLGYHEVRDGLTRILSVPQWIIRFGNSTLPKKGYQDHSSLRK